MKINIIYWIGTGNTEAMAKFIKEGAESAGVEVLSCHAFHVLPSPDIRNFTVAFSSCSDSAGVSSEIASVLTLSGVPDNTGRVSFAVTPSELTMITHEPERNTCLEIPSRYRTVKPLNNALLYRVL